jgi:hypothetical protein
MDGRFLTFAFMDERIYLLECGHAGRVLIVALSGSTH